MRTTTIQMCLASLVLACRFDTSGTGSGSDDGTGTGTATEPTGMSTGDVTTTMTTASTATTSMAETSSETSDPTGSTGDTGSTESTGAGETGIPGAWWNVDWAKRRRIALALPEGVDDAQSSMPIPIVLDAERIPYDELQDRGQDLRFVDGDDTTPLAYEIEAWDPGGRSTVWVLVPELQSTDAIYMYWGNADAPPGQASGAVWSVGFGGVYHLADDPEGAAGYYRDSSPGDRHAIPEGGMTTDDRTAGLASPALAFDGLDDAAAIAGLDTDDWTELTVSAWINRTGNTDERLVGKAFDSSGSGDVFMLRIAGGSVYARLRTDGEGQTSAELFGAYIPSATWTHVAMVWSHAEGMLRFYLDGEQIASQPHAGESLFNANADVAFARGVDGQDSFFEGVLDEVRVEHDARSGDWLQTQVAAMRDEIATFEAEELVP
jgi:hypothetical protein